MESLCWHGFWIISNVHYLWYPTYTLVPYLSWFPFLYHGTLLFITYFPNKTPLTGLILLMLVQQSMPCMWTSFMTVVPLKACSLEPSECSFSGTPNSCYNSFKESQLFNRNPFIKTWIFRFWIQIPGNNGCHQLICIYYSLCPTTTFLSVNFL